MTATLTECKAAGMFSEQARAVVDAYWGAVPLVVSASVTLTARASGMSRSSSLMVSHATLRASPVGCCIHLPALDGGTSADPGQRGRQEGTSRTRQVQEGEAIWHANGTKPSLNWGTR